MKRLRPWLGAALASIVLNLVFFSLMPLMTNQKTETGIRNIQITSQVNIVRLKEPDPEKVKKEPEKKIPDPKKEVKKDTLQNINQPRQVINNFPTLDFKVNPNLPATPMAPVFPMEKVNFSPRVMNKIYTGADIDKSLVPMFHVPPVYPFQAKRRGIEGWVRVSFLVNTRGEVKDISIIESFPGDIFNQSVLNTLPRWKFSPGTVQGVTVNTRVETTIRFQLEN